MSAFTAKRRDCWRWIGLLSLLTALFTGGCAPGATSEGGSIHPCAGAGSWYPADPQALRSQVEGFLAAAEGPIPAGRIQAIVVPHAGYDYCGKTAAYAYRAVRGQPVKRVIVLAISHRAWIDGASVLNAKGYETPLGLVPVDQEAAAALLKSDGFGTVEAAHQTEHSDENQLPFLQCALGDFKLVSILVGSPDSEDPAKAEERLEGLAKAIRPWVDDQTLIVASSDFTHWGIEQDFLPFRHNGSENLKALDGEAAYFLTQRDLQGFLDSFLRTRATVCGRADLALMLKILGEGPPGVVLHYDRSGSPDTDPSNSVGYFAMAFSSPAPAKEFAESPASAPASGPSAEKPVSNPDWIAPAWKRAELNAEEQQTLLRLAREAIAARMDASSRGRLKGEYEITPRLMAPQGAFVTLTEKGDLRGCIGCVAAPGPLYANVVRMAGEAGFGDPRFPALTQAELARIHISISALLTPDGEVDKMPTRKLESIEQIRVGQDGLTIRKGAQGGLLLPQVPTEQGWNRDQFLMHLCEKAGLPPQAWKDAEIERFTAQVFGEPTQQAAQ